MLIYTAGFSPRNKFWSYATPDFHEVPNLRVKQSLFLFFSLGNLYMDSRQSMSMMGPPGYPHMPPMSNAGPTMTGAIKWKHHHYVSLHELFF